MNQSEPTRKILPEAAPFVPAIRRRETQSPLHVERKLQADLAAWLKERHRGRSLPR